MFTRLTIAAMLAATALVTATGCAVERHQETVGAYVDDSAVTTKVNAKFARVEQIKKFFLLETQLSAEDEELTPTMKLKRKLVQAKYAQRIEAMYG